MSGHRLRAWDGRDVETLARVWGVVELEAWDKVGSTNDRAIRRAEEGAPSWTVVVADEQSRGRGRRGSMWRSASGAGLWMSVLLRRVAVDGPLPLVVGVACAEAVEASAPGLRVGVKWPNDLMVGGRKVGGILCESVDGGVVVGVGVNVARVPEGLDLPATALEVVAGRPLARSELAGAFVHRLRARLDTATPFRDILKELRRRDVLEGARVETEEAGAGLASGIASSGALVLARADGSTINVVSGGVRFSGQAG